MNIFVMLTELVAQYAANAVSIGACHQPKEPAALKKMMK